MTASLNDLYYKACATLGGVSVSVVKGIDMVGAVSYADLAADVVNVAVSAGIAAVVGGVVKEIVPMIFRKIRKGKRNEP